MSDQLKPESHPPPVLQYEPPSAGPRRRGAIAAVAFCTASCLAAAVAFAIVNSLYNFHAIRDSAVILGGCVAICVAVAVILQRSARWRHVAAGIWIGLGATALIEGICFASTR